VYIHPLLKFFFLQGKGGKGGVVVLDAGDFLFITERGVILLRQRDALARQTEAEQAATYLFTGVKRPLDWWRCVDFQILCEGGLLVVRDYLIQEADGSR
jgi:hypothetical protein